MLVVLTLAVTLVLLLAVTVVVLYGGQSPRAESTAPGAGQGAAMQDASVQPGQSEATVAQTQATEPTAPSQRTTPPVTLDALGASGCAAAAEDAGLLVAYGSEYSNGSGWGTAHAEGQLERQIVRRICLLRYSEVLLSGLWVAALRYVCGARRRRRQVRPRSAVRVRK